MSLYTFNDKVPMSIFDDDLKIDFSDIMNEVIDILSRFDLS